MNGIMQRLTKEHTTARLDELLRADHAALEATFRRTLGKLKGGDPDAIRAGWLAMEQELDAHLAAEERYVLPAFAKVYPREAARIASEHVEIRSLLFQLGLDLDLHSLREENAELFFAKLQQHAQYEEGLLYEWAEEELPVRERHSVTSSLRAIYQVLSGSSARVHEPRAALGAERASAHGAGARE